MNEQRRIPLPAEAECDRSAHKRAAGLREARIWIIDAPDSDFIAEARRQALLIRDADDDADATAFFEAAADTDGWNA